ncbi:DUF6766 family protein [Microbacterium trichothecenolyticum]|uniref:DUF6766 family protein n=1 Tax=Microbacterium trichothecenolyticum TaxID=69370 RepID=UPI00286ADA9A|nr:DUF6766 family protein [Microbacterium trichothecenolyticum]
MLLLHLPGGVGPAMCRPGIRRVENHPPGAPIRRGGRDRERGGVLCWPRAHVGDDAVSRSSGAFPAETAVRVLAAGATVAFAIYLRQRGSSESKPVGMPHRVSADCPGIEPAPAPC